MGLLDKFKRKSEAANDGASSPDAVAAARTRARRRLIGATVLLVAGIIGFPLLFETQPRPIPIDVPIEIPNKDRAPPLVLSPAPGATVAGAAPESPPDRPDKSAEAESAAHAGTTQPKAAEVITERAEEQGREVVAKAAPASAAAVPPAAATANRPLPQTPEKSPDKPAERTTEKAHDKPVDRPVAKPADTPAEKVADKPADKSRAADAQRAQALLEGKPASTNAAPAPAASAAGAARVVVQVGAYTEAAKLREARAKVEKLGLKSYTQVVEVDGASRTRVRVGPFASKADADKAAARLRAAGLPAAILTL